VFFIWYQFLFGVGAYGRTLWALLYCSRYFVGHRNIFMDNAQLKKLSTEFLDIEPMFKEKKHLLQAA
jgi:hypothetical protein